MVFLRRPDEPIDGFAQYLDEEQATWGFVPNYAYCFADHPHVARAWKALNRTIVAGMDRRTYELASIAVARARRSTYCTTAHSKFLRDICDDPDALAAIDTDPDGGALPARDQAVYRFARTVATDASAVTQAQIDGLRAQGFSDGDIAGIAYAAAARMLFTAVLDGLGAQLDLQTAQQFDPDLLRGMVVGRPPSDTPSGNR